MKPKNLSFTKRTHNNLASLMGFQETIFNLSAAITHY